jgi:2'-5' RNA ligase
MKKVYTSAVVIIPPQEVWGPIQDIRIRYDRQINRWMPHITLLYPFRPYEEYDFIVNKFVKVCRSISQFEIILDELNFFHNPNQKYTLWISPSPKKAITGLQHSLLEISPDCNDLNVYKNGFVPHLSLGQCRSKSQTLALIEDIRKKWNKITFLLDQIYFIARTPAKNSKFEIKKSINLRKLT